MKDIKTQRLDKLKKEFQKIESIDLNLEYLTSLCIKLYEKGYSGIDILELLEKHKFMENQITNDKKYELLLTYNKVRKEFRNVKLLMLFILNFLFLSSETSLENISFM